MHRSFDSWQFAAVLLNKLNAECACSQRGVNISTVTAEEPRAGTKDVNSPSRKAPGFVQTALPLLIYREGKEITSDHR
jgi:hypothetical protein